MNRVIFPLILFVLLLFCSCGSKVIDDKPALLSEQNCEELQQSKNLFYELSALRELLPEEVEKKHYLLCSDEAISEHLHDGRLSLYIFHREFFDLFADSMNTAGDDSRYHWLYPDELWPLKLLGKWRKFENLEDNYLNRYRFGIIAQTADLLYRLPLIGVLYTDEMRFPEVIPEKEHFKDGKFSGKIVLMDVRKREIICAFPLKFSNSKKIDFEYTRGDSTDFRSKASEALITNFTNNFRSQTCRMMYLAFGLEPDSVSFRIKEDPLSPPPLAIY